MANPNDTDLQKVLHLLRAALGDIDPKQPLHKLFASAPQCGPFEWMLSILAMEIDLRVDIPEKLADDRKLTAEAFAKRVAALPKIDFPTYTLDCLALVAQALLSLESENPSRTSGIAGTRRKGATATRKSGTKTSSRTRDTAEVLESGTARKPRKSAGVPRTTPKSAGSIRKASSNRKCPLRQKDAKAARQLAQIELN
ncbi:MAG: hypothetical protein QM784_39875 [Polyangiaceae bacterium]